MLPAPDPAQCPNNHDPFTLGLSIFLCTGLVISYLPQHIRIISAGTSEGLSPFFLLLGATSSASGMLNLLIMQWPLIECCRVVSGGQCAESLMRFLQVFLQWLLFSIILILYLVYFPRVPHMLPPSEHEGYGTNGADEDTPEELVERRKVAVEKNKLEWREAIGMSWLVSLHLVVLTLLSIVLLFVLPSRPQHPVLRQLATFCGLSATALAVCQYAPQIVKTYNARLVGALSLGTMAIQVPGSILFCASIMAGEGTDWTSWLPYAITGFMQFTLMIICLMWRRREKLLGIDDFGEPLPEAEPSEDERAALLGN